MSTFIEQIRTAHIAWIELIHDHDTDGRVHHWFVVHLEMRQDEDHVQTVQLTVTYDPEGNNLQRFLDENHYAYDHSTETLRHIHQGHNH